MTRSTEVRSQRIVVCSLERWDDVWRRNQYLIDGLLREDPELEVLFVEPSSDPLHTIRRGGRPQHGGGLRSIDGYDGRLHAFEPTKWFPRRLGTMADASLGRQVRRAVAGLGWTTARLWINDPSWVRFMVSTGWPSLYDITDDWLLADREEREHRRLVEAEAVLLRECAEVVVCSPALEKVKGASRAVTLIGNAVDVKRYRRPVPRPSDLPDRPVALYVGTLHTDRLDVDLVIATALRVDAAGGSLVLVGPNALEAADRSRLESATGVLVLGPRSWAAIPAYLQHAHALVVPHVVTEFTDSLDPIKLYEYLAVGRPVISTPVAGFRDHGAGIVVASGGEFAAAVAAAVSTWTAPVHHARIPDWTARASAMRAVLDRMTGSPT
jgi:glycosyltransferase involved in cell wall biosynthesis